MPPQNQQFKFGLPPQGQPQNNPPHFQDSDVSMRTARPVKQNMITHIPNAESNNLFYSYEGNETDYLEPQSQKYFPDYASNYEPKNIHGG